MQLWIEDVQPGHDALVEAHGFVAYRDLWQLRRDLPADPSGLETTGFEPDRDLDDFLGVNARAFAWHPEQGQLSADDVRARMAEPWFDADGFRLLRIDGALAGFCWTKVHTNEDPVVGEIYAIAIDPDFHGQGLGGPMTLAGLEYLSSQGITVGNLYVESDNDPANRVYDRLGFAHHTTNRAYHRGIEAPAE